MINITVKILVFFLVLTAACLLWADDADTLAVPPVAVDTLAAALVSAADSAAAPAPDAVLGPEPAPPISYTGALFSAVIPGSGQIYHKNYILGVGFLAAEAIAGGVALNRRETWTARMDKLKPLREIADTIGLHGDSISLYSAGWYSAYADREEYEARRIKYTAYDALAWAAGIHYYNFMDALERGGVTARGKAKSPTVAGFLAAVPFLGLGQLYNGHPGKAGMITMTQTALAVIAFNDHKLMEYAFDKYNDMRDSTSAQFAYRGEHLAYWKSSYDRAFSRRNTYLWISLFSYIYSIFDSVVDAHLSDYAERIHFGPDLSIGADGGGASLKMSVEF